MNNSDSRELAELKEQLWALRTLLNRAVPQVQATLEWMDEAAPGQRLIAEQWLDDYEGLSQGLDRYTVSHHADSSTAEAWRNVHGVPDPANLDAEYVNGKWEPQCPYGDMCSRCDAIGYCERAESRPASDPRGERAPQWALDCITRLEGERDSLVEQLQTAEREKFNLGVALDATVKRAEGAEEQLEATQTAQQEVPPITQFADWYLSGQLFADPAELLRQLLTAHRDLEEQYEEAKSLLEVEKLKHGVTQGHESRLRAERNGLLEQYGIAQGAANEWRQRYLDAVEALQRRIEQLETAHRALRLIADEIEAGRETQLSPEKIRDVAEGATTGHGTGTAETVGSDGSGASLHSEVGDASTPASGAAGDVSAPEDKELSQAPPQAALDPLGYPTTAGRPPATSLGKDETTQSYGGSSPAKSREEQVRALQRTRYSDGVPATEPDE